MDGVCLQLGLVNGQVNPQLQVRGNLLVEVVQPGPAVVEGEHS